MASEIIRDGVKYTIGRTYGINSSGKVTGSFKGGKITESDVDSCLEMDKQDAELERLEQESKQEEAETMRPYIPENKKSKSKQRRII